MPRKIKAILIDPFYQTVERIEVEADRQGLIDINSLLSLPGHDCQHAECYPVSAHDYMFMDDSAALDAALPWFTMKTTNRGDIQIFGRALILGSSSAGNNASVKFKLSQVADRIEFPSRLRSMFWKLNERLSDVAEIVPALPEAQPVEQSFEMHEVTREDLLDRMFGRGGAA